MTEFPWPAVGVISGIVMLSVGLLGLYIRYLIQTHILTCPYPRKFEEALASLAQQARGTSDELHQHVRYHLPRYPEHPNS